MVFSQAFCTSAAACVSLKPAASGRCHKPEQAALIVRSSAGTANAAKPTFAGDPDVLTLDNTVLEDLSEGVANLVLVLHTSEQGMSS